MRAVGEANSVLGDVLAEGFEAVDLEGQMGQVGLNLDRAAIGKVAKLDGFFAFLGFQEDQFRTARGFVAAHFFEAEDLPVEADGAFEVVYPVPGMEEFEGQSHGGGT